MFEMKHLIVVLLVVLLVFGAKKLRTIGSDLGAAVKGFKQSMNDGENETPPKQIRSPGTDADFNEPARAAAPEKQDRSV